jgi:hypothetical protein
MFTPSLPARSARNSGKVSKLQLMPSRAAGAIPSTLANSPAKNGRSIGRVGATENPQLPASTVVTPWKHEAVA